MFFNQQNNYSEPAPQQKSKFSQWIKNNWLTVILSTITVGLLIIGYFFGWASIKKLLFFVVIFAFFFFLPKIWNFVKYFFFWDFQQKFTEYTLDEIWKKAGIIEIRGGAQTGKSLCIILLTKYLKGKKWTNIPNIIPGCQRLTLETLKKHWYGEFEEGLIGRNNVLLIDEAWNFFAHKELKKADLEKELGSLLFFLSETSKTNYKIFYVAKQGAQLPKAFNLLSANKTATIQVIAPQFYCRWWGKNYYHLIIKFNGRKLIIPYSEKDLELFDNTWNLDKNYARNRLISIIDKLDADELVQMLGYKLSRSQKMQEEVELEAWAKKFGDKNVKGLVHSQMSNKFWEMMRQKGWKPAQELLQDQEEFLEQQLEQRTITPQEYEKKKQDLKIRWISLNKKIKGKSKKTDKTTEETEQAKQIEKQAKNSNKVDLAKFSEVITGKPGMQENSEEFDDPDYDPQEEGGE